MSVKPSANVNGLMGSYFQAILRLNTLKYLFLLHWDKLWKWGDQVDPIEMVGVKC